MYKLCLILILAVSLSGCTAPLMWVAYERGKKKGAAEEQEKLQEKDVADEVKTE